jgi:hypothetical protein
MLQNLFSVVDSGSVEHNRNIFSKMCSNDIAVEEQSVRLESNPHFHTVRQTNIQNLI